MANDDKSIDKAIKDDFYMAFALQDIEKLFHNPSLSNIERMQKIRQAITKIESMYSTTLASKVQNWVECNVIGGQDFHSLEIEKHFGLASEKEKKNLHMALKRMEDDEVIKHDPKRRGRWWKLDQELLPLDWKNAKGIPLDIDWPLNINSFFRTLPKSILVISGTPESGKTAFFLEFIKRNMKTWGKRIHYFCSDMGEDEMKDRLSMHEDLTIDDWDFQAYERGSCFADCVQPDDINIYDFIEVHGDDFPYVGKWIKEIWHRLNKGIALVGLQKMWGATLGRGGLGTIEKARLYLTIEFDKVKQCGIMKVEKCKNKVKGTNYSGHVHEFKLYDGWKFTPGEWHPEYDSKKAYS